MPLLAALVAAGALVRPTPLLAQTGQDIVSLVGSETTRTGQIISETWQFVELKLAGGVTIKIRQDQVQSIQHHDSPVAFERATRGLMPAGEYAEALKRLTALKPAAVRQSWFNPDRAFHIAECQRGMGNLQEATKAYKAYLQQYPQSRFVPDAVRSLGLAHMALKQHDEARKQFSILATGKYGNVWTYLGKFELASLLRAEGHPQQAADAFRAFAEEVEALKPRPPKLNAALNQARVAVAQALIQAKNYQGAYDYLRTLLNEAGEFRSDSQATARAYNLLGDSCAARDEPEEARYFYLHTYVLFPAAQAEVRYALDQAYKITVEIWNKNKSPHEKQRAERLKEIRTKEYPD